MEINLNDTSLELSVWLEGVMTRMLEMMGEGKEPVLYMGILNNTQTIEIRLLPDNPQTTKLEVIK